MAIKLGEKVKDTVTGFTGIAVERIEHFRGGVEIAIQPIVAPSYFVEPVQLPETRLRKVASVTPKPRTKTTKRGGTK